MDPAFEVHMLTEGGKVKAARIAAAFDGLLTLLQELGVTGREYSIMRTKLEEACFFAKKGMAKDNAQ